MRRLATTLILPLALPIMLGACASTSTMREAPLSEGEERTFDADFEAVIGAAREAVADAGLGIEDAYEVDDDTFVIIGRARSSAFSYGGYARAVIERVAEGRTVVRVFTKRKVATNVTAKGDYSGPIFSTLTTELRTADAQ